MRYKFILIAILIVNCLAAQANEVNENFDSANTAPLSAGVRTDIFDGQLTQIQLQHLANHDIVLLVDKSGSMSTDDCPSQHFFSKSRWQWCQQQIQIMARQTQDALPAGFTVILFDMRFYVFQHVNVEGLAQIFNHNTPFGGTDLALPLDSVMRDYFNRKKMYGRVKPLLIGIITDGCPNVPKTVHQVLISTTRAMSQPNEITVIFFLIGKHDHAGEKFVWEISNNLTSEGAAFNIVKSVPFDELQEVGLARALADNLQ